MSEYRQCVTHFACDCITRKLLEYDRILQERNDLRYLHDRIAERVMPGTTDSCDAMVQIIKERDELLEQEDRYQQRIADKDEAIGELQSDRQILLEALEFYTLKSNYSIVDEGRNYSPEYKCYELDENTYAEKELGTKAREAIAKVTRNNSREAEEK